MWVGRRSSCCCWFNIVFSRFRLAFWSITQSSSRSSTSNFRICISSMSNRTAVNHGQSDNVSSPFLHWTNLGKYLKFVWLYIVSIKTGTRRIMRLEGMRLKRRTTRDSSSRRKVRLVSVFMLESHNQTNNKCLLKFAQTAWCVINIKKANLGSANYNSSVSKASHSVLESSSSYSFWQSKIFILLRNTRSNVLQRVERGMY